jgi:hypothetical protein
MDSRIRGLLLGIAAVQVVFAVGFVFQVPTLTAVWPFAGTTPLSQTFIGSIFAAAAAATAWCAWAQSDRGLAGIALDYLAILAPAAVISLIGAAGGGGVGVAAFGVASLVGALFGVWLLRRSLARPWRDARPLPRLVRWSFAFFIVALLIAGGALAIQVPDIMPWTITPELSTLFGLMFLGAAAYFTFALVEPRWENAGGQLAGFLAYDVVLVLPFLQRLPTIPENLRINLVIYTAVVIASGILAFWYLAIDRRTRIGSSRDDGARSFGSRSAAS